MSPTTVSADIERPADVVFAYAIDPTHFHGWQIAVVAGRMDRAGTPDELVAPSVRPRPKWFTSSHPARGASAVSTARSERASTSPSNRSASLAHA